MKYLSRTQALLLLFFWITFLHSLQAQYVGTAPFVPERGGLIINEVSNGTQGAQEYLELLVVGSPAAPTAPVNLESWIIDDNNFPGSGQGNATGHLVFGACFQAVPPGSLILIYNAEDRNPAIPPDDPFDTAPADGVYIVPHNSDCLDACSSNPSTADANFCPCSDTLANPIGWQLGFRNAGDVFQIRDACETLVHGVSWGNVSVVPEFNTSPVVFAVQGDQGSRVIQFAHLVDNDWTNDANYRSVPSAANESPGAPNNTANTDFITAIRNGNVPMTGTIADCKDTDAGDLIAPARLDTTGLPITICLGEDLGAFANDYNAADEFTPDAAGFTFEYAFLLTNADSTDFSILQFNTNGDFDFTNLPLGNYIVWGFSYIQTNGSLSVVDFLNGVNTIQDIRDYNECGFDGDLENRTPLGNILEVQIVNTTTTLPPASLEACGANGGTATFDLTQLDSLLTNGLGTIEWFSDTLAPTLIGNPATFVSPSAVVFARSGAGACVSNFAPITLTVRSALQPVINQVAPIACPGDSSGILTATVPNGQAPFTFLWNIANVTQDTISNLAAGTYSVTVEDALGCSGAASFTLNDAVPLQLTCSQNTPVTTVGGSNGVGAVAITGGNAPYQIQVTGMAIDTQLTSSQNAVLISGLAAGDYDVNIQDALGCNAQCTFSISEPTCPFSLNLNSENISCGGSQDGSIAVQLSGGVEPYRVRWNTGDSRLQLQNLNPGNYQVTVTDAIGCTVSDSATISEPTPVSATIDTENPRCSGSADGQIIILDAQGGTGSAYQISGAGIPSQTVSNFPFTINNLSSGMYALTLADSNDCTVILTAALTEPEALSLELGPNQSVERGDTVAIQPIASFLIDSLVWMPDLNFVIQNGIITFPAQTTTTFSVEAFDANGCSVSDQITIVVENKILEIYVPNAFSPNFDGVNDYFTVFGNSDVSAVKLLQVFDRWGNLVYQNSDFPANAENLGWDGQFNGKLMPTGVYAYLVEVLFADGSETLYKGEITLLR